MSSFEYRRLRAPENHGEAFIEPALKSSLSLLRSTGLPEYDCQGLDLEELIEQARGDALRAAVEYTGQYRDVPSDSMNTDRPIIMAGHQPELYHAGVWLKNFVLHSVGCRHNAHRLNVLIDNDVVKHPSLRVPSGSLRHPHLSVVPMDRAEVVPFEEKKIADPALFDRFGGEVMDQLRPLISDPIVAQLWQSAISQRRSDPQATLGQVLGRVRHLLEAEWGLSTLEVPLSHLADTPSFRWFGCHLLANLPRFWEVYNQSLREYRQIHRLRSRSHPVPDLQERDGWLEAPFWLWHENSPGRRRVFARLQNDCLQISDHEGSNFCIPVNQDRSGSEAIEQLAKLRQAGLKLRPRALVTTMYFRLLLSDAFIHGIGGAKYDQLTDLMIRRFFGLSAPSFFVVSGTFQLPLERPSVSDEQLRQVRSQLRDLVFNPQRFLSEANPKAQALIEEKAKWLGSDQPAGLGRERHRAISSLNSQMQPLVEDQRETLSGRQEELQNQLRQRSLLSSREYSFCLFPEQTLRPLLEKLSRSP